MIPATRPRQAESLSPRQRRSLTRVEDILVDPTAPAPLPRTSRRRRRRLLAKDPWPPAARGAAVVLIYGAHLLRNGAARILERMMAGGWLTHLATNGAGTIHDWEYAWLAPRPNPSRRTSPPARLGPGTRRRRTSTSP